jgi:hypothetical protein
VEEADCSFFPCCSSAQLLNVNGESKVTLIPVVVAVSTDFYSNYVIFLRDKDVVNTPCLNFVELVVTE